MIKMICSGSLSPPAYVDITFAEVSNGITFVLQRNAYSVNLYDLCVGILLHVIK